MIWRGNRELSFANGRHRSYRVEYEGCGWRASCSKRESAPAEILRGFGGLGFCATPEDAAAACERHEERALSGAYGMQKGA